MNQRSPIATQKVLLKNQNLKVVPKENYKLFTVVKQCQIMEFVGEKSELKTYNPALGYGFFELTKPEYISYNHEVIVMDKVLICPDLYMCTL